MKLNKKKLDEVGFCGRQLHPAQDNRQLVWVYFVRVFTCCYFFFFCFYSVSMMHSYVGSVAFKINIVFACC